MILEVNSVSKSYGRKVVLDDISFSVPGGEIFGLLGPNGAGKTTAIRIIMDIISADGGNVRIFGEDFNDSLTDRIGYLPEDRGLYRKRKVLSTLSYFGQLKGMDKDKVEHVGGELLEKFGLKDYKEKKIEELSKGMQQKVQFIASILHDPELMILDEPFAGLDPINAELIKDVILDLKGKGKTIALSTHMLERAEKLCDKILLINKGKNVLCGDLSEIKKRHGRNTIILGLRDGNVDLNLPQVESYNAHGNYAEIKLKKDADPQELLGELIKSQIKIRKFEIAEPSLNEIFINAVNKD
ncbi:MAG: hypothetical protein A7316_08250 [Candidatus Altiarchaeales archaeon WOR_SM1_86-2]|nr:MAG: hypothetical protein A7316_08250 [Candidatus Altiarchaeales archaeon WOR_SM1_86-2]